MAIDWAKFCRRALQDVRLMCGKPAGGEMPSPFPLTADGTKVPVEVTGLEMGDVSIEFPAVQNVAGSVAVTNFPAAPAFPTSIEVSNFPAFPAVQEVSGSVGAVCSGTVAVSNFPAFPSSFAVSNFPASQVGLTDGELRATPLNVAAACSGTVAVSNFPAPVTTVSVDNFPTPPSVQEVSGSVAATCSGTVAVSNFPPTQAVTLAACPLPAGAATETTLAAIGKPSTLCVTATGIISASVPVVLPAPGVGLFHYITAIDIVSYAGATIATSATPVLITTTNLPGNPVFNHQRLHTAGQSFSSGLRLAGNPLRSSVANTATTVVCPVLTGCVWRVNVTYYIGP